MYTADMNNTILDDTATRGIDDTATRGTDDTATRGTDDTATRGTDEIPAPARPVFTYEHMLTMKQPDGTECVYLHLALLKPDGGETVLFPLQLELTANTGEKLLFAHLNTVTCNDTQYDVLLSLNGSWEQNDLIIAQRGRTPTPADTCSLYPVDDDQTLMEVFESLRTEEPSLYEHWTSTPGLFITSL